MNLRPDWNMGYDCKAKSQMFGQRLRESRIRLRTRKRNLSTSHLGTFGEEALLRLVTSWSGSNEDESEIPCNEFAFGISNSFDDLSSEDILFEETMERLHRNKKNICNLTLRKIICSFKILSVIHTLRDLTTGHSGSFPRHSHRYVVTVSEPLSAPRNPFHSTNSCPTTCSAMWGCAAILPPEVGFIIRTGISLPRFPSDRG